MKYKINDIYYSIQCEGYNTGIPMVFVRFSGCNMRCDINPGPKSPGGFKCDTEFESGQTMTLDEISRAVLKITYNPGPCSCRWILLTGGEPALQVDAEFVQHFQSKRYKLAIETNGSVAVNEKIDWVTLSPKVAEHAVVPEKVNEVKYVRSAYQSIPKPAVKADHYFISPASVGGAIPKENIKRCEDLVKEHTSWRLSLQAQHLIGME
mgnify:CR=1 FL=1